MKSFLAIFTCAKNSKNHQLWQSLDPSLQQARIRDGEASRLLWFEKYKNKIVRDACSLSPVTKAVDHNGVRDCPSQMGAFVIVKANSHNEAAEMFVNHPHFVFFPGDGVEILECLENPFDLTQVK